eukprot:7377508-Prymnesium_polylepis.1
MCIRDSPRTVRMLGNHVPCGTPTSALFRSMDIELPLTVPVPARLKPPTLADMGKVPSERAHGPPEAGLAIGIPGGAGEQSRVCKTSVSASEVELACLQRKVPKTAVEEGPGVHQSKTGEGSVLTC